MNTERTFYQDVFETHYNALLGMFRHLITQFADESVEIAARAVALAAPLPNAINMYNVAVKDLGYAPFAAFAFSLTLEIVVFLLVEIALRMWDRYLTNPQRYGIILGVAVAVVLVSVAVVMRLVYVLETHKIMALLPVVSLCSFVGIGLKRWDERHADTMSEPVKTVVVPEVQPQNDDTINRRKELAAYCNDKGFSSLQIAADDLSYTSKTAVRNDLLWLEKQGIVHVNREGKTLNVRVNGHFERFMNG